MPARLRPSPAPGPGRGRAGRRPTSAAPTKRRSTRATASEPPPGQGASSSRSKLTGRAAILLLVLAVLTVSYASSMRAWLKQRSEINTLSAEIATHKADVAVLEQTRRRWHDPAYIETQARLRFGWVLPGETGYRVIGADGNILSDGVGELSDPNVAAPAHQPEWWQNAWGSVVDAGANPADKATPRPTHRPARHIGGSSHQGRSPAR